MAFIIGALSELVGAPEPALKLLITILAGYPLAYVYRKCICGKPPQQQHLFYFLSGFTLGYLNYGNDMFHTLFAVLFSYATMFMCGATTVCVAIVFIFNMTYLVFAYFYTSTEGYDIIWTMPYCVLVLRLIGTVYDFCDGFLPDEKLSKAQKAAKLVTRPSLLEFLGHNYFPASFLVGPQYPMTRYKDFVNGKFIQGDDKTIPPDTVQPALKRFCFGLFYLAIYQGIGVYISDDFIMSDAFGEHNFWKKCFYIGIWGRVTMYKYISCWLFTEGACILFGLSYNGKEPDGTPKWDGLANVDIWRFECSTEFNHYIQSFNINTNHWCAEYIYKRLKFMNNRYISQTAVLVFLAIWHGFHTGYYVCFFMEFIIMFMEKDISSIVSKYPHVKAFFSGGAAKVALVILLRIYTFVFMGWCLVPFVHFNYAAYMKVFSMLNWMGFIAFVPWPLIYRPAFVYAVKATRPAVTAE